MKKRLLKIGAVAMATVCALTQASLGLTNSEQEGQTIPFGDCAVAISINVPMQQAGVSVSRASDYSVKFAGGSFFTITGIPITGQAPVTEAYLESCLNAPTGSVTNLSQDGADESFQADDYIGFSFTLTDSFGGLTAGDYEYGIGTNPSQNADTTPPTVAFSPTDGATGIAGNGNITLTFDEAVRNLDDSALTDSNVGALIVLKDTDANGESLPFDATITGNVITINPTSDFTSSQAVYVAIGATVEDSAGNALMASSATFTTADTSSPTVAITGPTGSVTGDFTATFTFSEDVTGFDASDVTVVNGTKGTFSGSGTTYTLVISPDPGATVSVSVAAGLAADAASNLNTVSNTFTVQAGSVASAFDSARDAIREVLAADATRSLRSTVLANQRMADGALGRFLAGQAGDTPFDVSGSLDANGLTLSSKGTFFGQTGLADGSRRLVFGDFDVQHDSDTGSTTATLNGRMAWERMVSDKTLLGYFIGGELARSTLEGSFAGSQNRVGVTLGGYGVHQLGATTFADGFITLGAGRNNLAMTSELLDLTSNYTTRTATVGGALSGVFDHGKYELRPELAFSYGKTWIGNVGFTGSAYGLVDNTLSLDAGAVSIANLTLRPEVVLALDAGRVADSQSQLSFAPRLVCERRQAATTTKDCGGGAEIGLTSHSANGLSNATFRVIMDRVGASTQSSVAINLEHRF